MDKFLTEEQWQAAAQELNIPLVKLKAIAKVESPKGPFNPDGSPTTLFEGHKFHQFTDGRFSKSHPTLSYPKWVSTHYGKNWQLEKQRLEAAVKLDRDAALKSTSWGRFQIMGFNYKVCGCETLQEFINKMFESELSQLRLLINFLKNTNLDDALRNNDMDKFFSGYNGSGYKTHQYDVKYALALKDLSRTA